MLSAFLPRISSFSSSEISAKATLFIPSTVEGHSKIRTPHLVVPHAAFAEADVVVEEANLPVMWNVLCSHECVTVTCQYHSMGRPACCRFSTRRVSRCVLVTTFYWHASLLSRNMWKAHLTALQPGVAFPVLQLCSLPVVFLHAVLDSGSLVRILRDRCQRVNHIFRDHERQPSLSLP